MSIKTRAEWMEHVDALKVPDQTRREMRDFVNSFDLLLGQVIGHIHLTYLRNKQGGTEELAALPEYLKTTSDG